MEKGPGEPFQQRAKDVCKTNNVGPHHSKVSRARPADVGMVFRPKRARYCREWINAAPEGKRMSTDPSFKASLGWYQNWKQRHSVSLRTKTTLAQRLPEDLEEKIVQFHRFIIAARRQTDYPLSRIYNMDETPMRFELPSSRTLEFSGSRTVPVKSLSALLQMGPNLLPRSSLKASILHETSSFLILSAFPFTKKDGWMSQVCSSGFTSVCRGTLATNHRC
ncbi:hypothetical protein ACROYT_G014580 [Oculina patagonica]